MLITSKSHQVSNGFSYFDDLSQPTEELGGAKTVLGNGKIGWVQKSNRKCICKLVKPVLKLAFCDPPLIKLFAYKIDELAIQLFANESKHVD